MDNEKSNEAEDFAAAVEQHASHLQQCLNRGIYKKQVK